MALKIENNYDFNDNTNNTTDNNFDSKWTEPSKCTLIELFFECTNRKRVQRKWSHWVKNESDLVIIVFSTWFAIDPLLCLLEIRQLCIFSWFYWSKDLSLLCILTTHQIERKCKRNDNKWYEHTKRLPRRHRYIITDSFLLFAIFLNRSSDSVRCHNFSDIP